MGMSDVRNRTRKKSDFNQTQFGACQCFQESNLIIKSKAGTCSSSQGAHDVGSGHFLI